MVKTRKAVRNARGPLMILLVVSVLALAQHQDNEKKAATPTEEVTP